jgi:hypothetical protein
MKTHLDLDSCFIGKVRVRARESMGCTNTLYIDDIIDHADPTTLYTDFILVAEGESGPMYAAKQSSTSRTVSYPSPPIHPSFL